MSSPSKAVSESFAVTSSEVHLSADVRYSVITVENSTTAAVNVCVDSGTATAGAGTNMETVPPGGIASFGNLLPLANANTTPGTDESLSTGWQVQSGMIGTALTYASVCPTASTSGTVTISFE
jgi:hypothetical protein